MRIAVSGSHGTGKSTLVSAFLARCPRYQHEAEAFELLADNVELTTSEGPTPEGLQALLEHTIAALASYDAATFVVFERSPVDYLAYAAASRSWANGSAALFVQTFIPQVRRSLRGLDLIVFVPVSATGPQARSHEDPQFRQRVDEALRCALVDDDFGLFLDRGTPRVVELPPHPGRQLGELIRLTTAGPDV